MSDLTSKELVTRLRRGEACGEAGNLCRSMDANAGCICAQAADEIERLQQKLWAVADLIFTNDRDGAKHWASGIRVSIKRDGIDVSTTHEPRANTEGEVGLAADVGPGGGASASASGEPHAPELSPPQPPLDARYCPFNHKPCEPIDLAEETSETKSETVMSKVREHFDAQRDRDGYHSELERLEFAPPADPGPSFDMLGELKKRLMWCPALVGSNPHEWNGDGKCRHCGGERPSAETSNAPRSAWFERCEHGKAVAEHCAKCGDDDDTATI